MLLISGDLWSYNAKNDVFVVSPEPDLHVYDLDIQKCRCLILATDGAWNVLSPDMAVQAVYEAEKNNEQRMIRPNDNTVSWINPSKRLVDNALDRWNLCRLRADNTTVVTAMLDPPGPTRGQVLRMMHGVASTEDAKALNEQQQQANQPPALPPKPVSKPENTKGISLLYRLPNSKSEDEKTGLNLVRNSGESGEEEEGSQQQEQQRVRFVHDSVNRMPQRMKVRNAGSPQKETEQPAQPPVRQQRANNKVEEVLDSNGDHIYEGVDSPAPPPLPERRAKKPATSTASNNSQQNQQQPPPRPVKGRRSVAPVPNEYGSDTENHVPDNSEPAKDAKRTTRSSLGKALTNVVKKPLLRTSRRSEPVLRAPQPPQVAGSSASSSQLTPNSNRVLRSRANLIPPAADTAPTAQTVDLSGGLKRKRRSLEQSLPASKQTKGHTRSSTWNAANASLAKRARVLRNQK